MRAAALFALTLLTTPAGAGCRLALALGFDVSRSVDQADYEIQRGGIIAALHDPGIRALLLEPADRVALAIYEWGGRDFQELVLDWTVIGTEADIDRVAGLLAVHVHSPAYQATAIGQALQFGHGLMAVAPACSRRTLDVSGDGRSNDGKPPATVYAESDFTGITVNGLAIGGHETDIRLYYLAEVIRGPGAFAMGAVRHTEFPEVFRRKLLRELTEALMGGLPVSALPAG